MNPDERGGWIDRLALIPALAVVAFVLLGPVQSGDLWWHLEVGDWIREHLALPWKDPFSHTAGDARYVPQEMGSQVVLSALDALGGTALLKIVGAALGVALVLAFARLARERIEAPWANALAALFAAAYALRWELRPHLVSTLVMLWIFQRLFPPERTASVGPRAREIAALGLVTLVWVWLHAEAVFAPLFACMALVACALGGAVDLVRGRPFPIAATVRWALASAVALAASFASPLGWWPHRYALFERAKPALYIDEWFPAWIAPGDPRFAPLDPVVAALLVALLLVTAIVLVRGIVVRFAGRDEPPSWERLALLAACVFLAFTARRYFWLLAIPALDAVLALHHSLRPTFAARVARARIVPGLVALAAAGVLAQSHFSLNAFAALREGRYTEAADRRLFPVHATALLREAGPAGNLFHPYDWGGYLLRHLGARNPIFIDGRTTLFADVLPERWRAERDAAFAREVFERRDVRAIVSRRFVMGASPPAPYRPPDTDTRWIRVHADTLAELWVRSDEHAALERIAAWYAERGVPFDPARGFVELEVWLARPDWLEERDLLPRAVARALAPEVERVRGAPHDPDAWIALARAALSARIGRSARWALERSIEARAASDPDFDAAIWRARLSADGPAAVLANWPG